MSVFRNIYIKKKILTCGLLLKNSLVLNTNSVKSCTIDRNFKQIK